MLIETVKVLVQGSHLYCHSY